MKSASKPQDKWICISANSEFNFFWEERAPDSAPNSCIRCSWKASGKSVFRVPHFQTPGSVTGHMFYPFIHEVRRILLNITQSTYWHNVNVHWWAQERRRISPSRFLAECHKRWLNQGSFVLFCCILCRLHFWFVSVCVFSCTVWFVSISQATGCEDRLRNDLGSLTHSFTGW